MATAILSLKWQNSTKIIKAVEVIKITNAAICSKLQYLASNLQQFVTLASNS